MLLYGIQQHLIAGKDNKTDNEKSRHFNEAIEWMLNKSKFNECP